MSYFYPQSDKIVIKSFGMKKKTNIIHNSFGRYFEIHSKPYCVARDNDRSRREKCKLHQTLPKGRTKQRK